MTAGFIQRNPASRVVFGAGSVARLAAELRALGVHRPLVASGRRTARSALHAAVRQALTTLPARYFDGVPAHSSVATINDLVTIARREAVDGLVAVGGGSASDSAKATALLLAEGGRLEDHASRFTPPDQLVVPVLPAPKLPIVALPCTASAAEVTPSLGVRGNDGYKLLFTDPQLAARLIIIDPAASHDVPVALLLSTGINGLAHCLEGLYSSQRCPASTALALHAIALFNRCLPALAESPDDIGLRGDLLAAANLSGQVLLNARTCLHHAICHVLGAHAGSAHGDANAVMLPAAIAFNADAAPVELAAAARACGLAEETAASLIEHLRSLQQRLGVPTRLGQLGVRRDQLPHLAEQVMHERGLFFNPRRVRDANDILNLLERVF
ncbi:iron-containing alcohol dehydrogenase family protein [Piscinibacter sakaiensis]|uniref:iron-containing alcohol dehydrogenase family protein n=1 Tax=Piscinibacter sakaiensis TaxID=1547922 RepID=UPI003AAF67C9